MQVEIANILSTYDKYWKAHSWHEELLFSDNSKLYLMFACDGDYVCVNIGTSSQEFCLNLPLNEARPALKTFCGKMATVNIKNNKIQFVSEDSKSKFVLAGTIGNSPELSVDKKTKIKLPLNVINFATNFVSREFPMNLVYVDKDSQSVFSSSGFQIFGNINFKNPLISIPTFVSKLFENNKASATEFYINNGFLFYTTDSIIIKAKVFEPAKESSVYYALIEKPNHPIEFNIEELKQALMAHSVSGISTVALSFQDNTCYISGAMGETMAIKTQVSFTGKAPEGISAVIYPKETIQLCNFLQSNDSSTKVKFTQHSQYANIKLLYSENYIFGVG